MIRFALHFKLKVRVSPVAIVQCESGPGQIHDEGAPSTPPAAPRSKNLMKMLSTQLFVTVQVSRAAVFGGRSGNMSSKNPHVTSRWPSVNQKTLPLVQYTTSSDPSSR